MEIYFESSNGVRHTQYNFSFLFEIPLLFEVAILILVVPFLRPVDVLPFDVVPTVGVVDDAACLVGVGIALSNEKQGDQVNDLARINLSGFCTFA